MSQTPSSPFDGLRALHRALALIIAVGAGIGGALTIVPPPPPALAAPAPSPSPSPSATPGARPSAGPSALPASASPSPAPSKAPIAEPSPTPSPAPSPGASPTASPAVETDQKKIEMITHKMEHLNPTLKDWTAEVAIEARVKLALLVLPMDLHGRSYHKAPDKYKFELQNAPALLQKYQQVFGYRPISLNDFVATLLPDETVNGRPTYVVRLDRKSPGDFLGQTVWIDKESFTSPKRLYVYKDNGKIEVTFAWRKDGDFTLIDTMNAQFDFPRLNATASVVARYGGYRFDSGLDDALFIEKRPQRRP